MAIDKKCTKLIFVLIFRIENNPVFKFWTKKFVYFSVCTSMVQSSFSILENYWISLVDPRDEVLIKLHVYKLYTMFKEISIHVRFKFHYRVDHSSIKVTIKHYFNRKALKKFPTLARLTLYYTNFTFLFLTWSRLEFDCYSMTKSWQCSKN